MYLRHMLMTASVYMVVIIALERQRAINTPFKRIPGFADCSTFLIFLSAFQVRKRKNQYLLSYSFFQTFIEDGRTVLIVTQ